MPCLISDPPFFGSSFPKAFPNRPVPELLSVLRVSPPKTPHAPGSREIPKDARPQPQISPAAEGGLQQGGDAHAEEDGPDELAGGPLVKAHAHGIGQQEGHGDRPAETRQVVLGAQGWVSAAARAEQQIHSSPAFLPASESPPKLSLPCPELSFQYLPRDPSFCGIHWDSSTAALLRRYPGNCARSSLQPRAAEK